MKICSYNLFCTLGMQSPVPDFTDRLGLLSRKILILSKQVDVFFFQEVTEYNFDMLKLTLGNDFEIIGNEFPMLSVASGRQYNIIAIRKDLVNDIVKVTCLPHGKDRKYKFFDKQKISYGMSDYHTTLFMTLDANTNRYVIGNIHADHVSIEGKIKGILKSLEYMDKQFYTRAVLLGDMNMVPHMTECHTILSHNTNYITLSKNPDNTVPINSYHGYSVNESVNVDFAFVPKVTSYNYHWQCCAAPSIKEEGSDHRPVIITVD